MHLVHTHTHTRREVSFSLGRISNKSFVGTYSSFCHVPCPRCLMLDSKLRLLQKCSYCQNSKVTRMYGTCL